MDNILNHKQSHVILRIFPTIWCCVVISKPLAVMVYLIRYMYSLRCLGMSNECSGDRCIRSQTQAGRATILVESNTKLIGRPVPQISSFENFKMADFVTSLLTS